MNELKTEAQREQRRYALAISGGHILEELRK